jgi:Lar family restriction alleviation protein
MSSEMRECPFCGGEAERIDFGPGSGDNEGGSCVACTRCQASGPVEFGYKENFISNWNRRALLARTEAGAVSCTFAHGDDWTCSICGTPRNTRPQDASGDAAYIAKLQAALSEAMTRLDALRAALPKSHMEIEATAMQAKEAK